MNGHYRNKEVLPQINLPFRFIDIYHRKPSVALRVHPLRVVLLGVTLGGEVWNLIHFRYRVAPPPPPPPSNHPHLGTLGLDPPLFTDRHRPGPGHRRARPHQSIQFHSHSR